MATIRLEILEAAHKDGLIGIKVTKAQQLYLVDSVLTANRILSAIEERKDANGEQLEKDCKLARNTLNIYLRWLEKRKYIQSTKDKNEQGQPKLYWKI